MTAGFQRDFMSFVFPIFSRNSGKFGPIVGRKYEIHDNGNGANEKEKLNDYTITDYEFQLSNNRHIVTSEFD